LAQLATELNLTKERIRQIKNSTVIQIIKEVSTVRSVLSDCEVKTNNYFQNHSSLFSLSEIILKENISLAENMVYKILEIANPTKALIIDNPKKHFYKYLIPKYLKSLFDFNKFTSYINEKINNKIEKDFKIELSDLNKIFLTKSVETVDSNKLESIISEFLISEFGLNLINGRIEFKRNTKKKTYEYIVDILNLHGEPMHVNEILPILNKSFPKKPKKAEGVRSHCINHPETFINTAWSTYGLKKWETQGKQVGGTIKQVVVKYLQKCDKPKHIYEISNYVTKYRDTTKINIWGNINLDPKKVFAVYNGGFVGLSEKNYSKNDTLFNNVKNSWFRLLKSDFLVNGRSQYKVENVYSEIAKKLRVLPIQIEALIAERIENEELILDDDNYIHIVKEEKPKFIESYMVKRNYLKESSLSLIVEELKNGEHLKALTLCLDAFKDLNIEITLKEGKRIVDHEYEKLIT